MTIAMSENNPPKYPIFILEEETFWQYYNVEKDGHTISMRFNRITGQKQIILNEELALVCGKSTIEELMMDDGILDFCCDVKKNDGIFPIKKDIQSR